jgi:hypothetical protein
MKRMKITLIFLLFTLIAKAPVWSCFVIGVPEPVQPYETIWRAVCQVESANDPLAYNKKENAVGVAQIRQIRIKDFNRRTGKNYKLKEMFCPVKSKEVFLYYAEKIKEPDKIIKDWNGSGKATYVYLKKVKKEML